jgi:inosose dehydratase
MRMRAGNGRRTFLQAALAAGVGTAVFPRAAVARTSKRTALRLGYAAITWQGEDEAAIADIAALGFHGIQLRGGAFDRWKEKPDELRRLLQEKGLALLCLSSGAINVDPAEDTDYMSAHLAHARFVKAAGGERLQILSERPKGRAPTAAEFERLGRRLSTLGQRTRDLGVRLLYHNHMGAYGEGPEDVARVLALTDSKAVGLLLDIAHYQQGGGDPVAAVKRHKDRLSMLHLKDVIGPLPGDTKPARESYKFVELGRGKVNVQGVIEALETVGFRGPVVVELDGVTDTCTSARDCAAANKKYCLETLGLRL